MSELGVQKTSRVPWIIVGILGIIAIIVGIYVGVNTANNQQEIDDANSRVSQLQEDVNQSQAQAYESNKALSADISGINVEKKADDDKIAEDIIKKVTTWSSADEYKQARNSLVQDDGISTDSQLLTAFMPDDVCNTDKSGQEYCSIDELKLNSSFDSFESRIVAVKPNAYDYFAVVGIAAQGEVTSATRYVPVTYTIDFDGKMSNIKAYTSSTDPVVSE